MARDVTMRTAAFLVAVVLVYSAVDFAQGKDCTGPDRGTQGATLTRFTIAKLNGSVVSQMRHLYTNCKRIFGALVINDLTDEDNTEFLDTIEEVYGYVDIYDNAAANITLPNLRIVRGREQLSSASFLFSKNPNLVYFNAPKLHEIESGNVDIRDSPSMRCADRIGWKDMMGGRLTPQIDPNIAKNPCTCDSSCRNGCFAPGAENCYTNTFLGCSALLCPKRCNSTVLPGLCCHTQCAGGCSNYGPTNCFSCVGKQRIDASGVRHCVAACPPLTIIDRQTFQEVPNPNGRYNHGLDCVENCSAVNRSTFNQDCVEICPTDTEPDAGGVCRPCGDNCRRTCLGTDKAPFNALQADYLQNNMTNCTKIEGDIQLVKDSFTYSSVYGSYQPLNATDPNQLDALLSVREITGCISIIDITLPSLSFLGNVRTVGRCKSGPSTALGIYINSRATVGYLGLGQLRRVQGFAYFQSKGTCYIKTLNWDKVLNNATTMLIDQSKANCTGRDTCSGLCADGDGCSGPSADDCYACRFASLYGTCYSSCSEAATDHGETRPLFLDQTTKECRVCDSRCFPNQCTGPTSQDCVKCSKVTFGRQCLETCPQGTYLNTFTKTCELCSTVCQDLDDDIVQCTGPGEHFGPGGCSVCTGAIVDAADKVVSCVLSCPADVTFNTTKYNQDGLQECRYCHAECKNGCYGTDAGSCMACRNQFHTGGSNQRICVPSCDSHEYATSAGECRPCHPQCSGGCSGDAPEDCQSCRAAFELLEGGQRRCLDTCPHFYTVANGSASSARQCVVQCPAKQYNNSDGHCRDCSAQCAAGCIDDGSSVLSCAGDCAAFEKESECVSECGASYATKEGSNQCESILVEEPTDAAAQKSNADTGVIAGSATAGVFIVAFAVLVAIFVCRRSRMRPYKGDVTHLEIPGMENPNYGVPGEVFMESEMLHVSPAQADPNMARLVLVQATEIVTGKELGEGAFGTVYAGEWVPADGAGERTKVAVKVLKENTGAASNKEILDEAVVMATVQHPYLVRLLCICMAPRVMLITELMELGSLLSYLRSRKKTLTGDALLLYGNQIAEGMGYLESKRLIHRDLAARNVLVAAHRCVKITDFGLARLLDVGSAEFQHDGGKMPVKWLAPECLQERIFTHQTDVWSFGVTMWELLTFGNAPFKGFKATQIFSMLLNGQRLPKPRVASSELHETLQQCWNWEPEMRPTFADLQKRFDMMCENPSLFCVTKADREGRTFASEADFSAIAPELMDVDDDGYDQLGHMRMENSSGSEYDNFAPPRMGNSFPSRDTLPGTGLTVEAGYDNMPASIAEGGNPYDNANVMIGGRASHYETPVQVPGSVDATAVAPYDNLPAAENGRAVSPFDRLSVRVQQRPETDSTGYDDTLSHAASHDRLITQSDHGSPPSVDPFSMDPAQSTEDLGASNPYLVPTEELTIRQTAMSAQDESNMVSLSNPDGQPYQNLGYNGI